MRPILTSATDKVDAQCAYPATISPLSGAFGALRPPPARRPGAEDRRTSKPPPLSRLNGFRRRMERLGAPILAWADGYSDGKYF